jgi:hypothetical protein
VTARSRQRMADCPHCHARQGTRPSAGTRLSRPSQTEVIAVNDAVALEVLEGFESLLLDHKRLYDAYSRDFAYLRNEQWKEIDATVHNNLLIVQQIVDQVVPGHGPKVAPQGSLAWEWHGGLDALRQAIGVLRGREILERALGPAGPRLSASHLHPWMWQAAATLWDDGHFRSAVQTAATVIDAQLQAKLDLYKTSGTDLVTRAFSPTAPNSGESRLRIDRFPAGSPYYTDAHQGAMHFGQGCMMAIRNIVTHLPDELDEQGALEQLAALSVLARWIDEARVEVAP